MRIDVMVDIETLGTKSDSTIFQISAIAFDIKNGEHISKFNKIADISKNEGYEMSVDGGTLLWWLNTDKELLTKLLNEGEGSSTDLLGEFYNWLVSIDLLGELYLWGNGILFDNKMIQHQLESIGLKYPISYRNDRDVRTLVDLASVKLGLSNREIRERYYDASLTPHNAFDDVINQINLVVGCYKELTGGEGHE